MGLLDFLKDKGKDLFGGGGDDPAKASQAIKKEVERALGSNVSNLSVQYNGGKVKLSGEAKSQAAKEKALLIAGNVKGVESVDDDGLKVAGQSASAAPMAASKLLHDPERRHALQDREGEDGRLVRLHQDFRGQPRGHRGPGQDLPGPAHPHPERLASRFRPERALGFGRAPVFSRRSSARRRRQAEPISRLVIQSTSPARSVQAAVRIQFVATSRACASPAKPPDSALWSGT